MTLTARIEQTRLNVFTWRSELSIPMKLALAFSIAVLTGLLAQVRFYVPWSPVPFTGQTMAVLLAGVALGKWWGGISMGIYAGLGMAGVPWFQGMGSGIAYMAGPTGGYIAGFILAALFLGYFTDKYIKSRRFMSMLGLMLFASLIIVYVPGLLQLGVWLHFVKGQAVSIGSLLTMGAVPFIAGDITKSVAAALIARGIAPQTSFGKETDR
jgi:biotin transport system substrate-specific component